MFLQRVSRRMFGECFRIAAKGIFCGELHIFLIWIISLNSLFSRSFCLKNCKINFSMSAQTPVVLTASLILSCAFFCLTHASLAGWNSLVWRCIWLFFSKQTASIFNSSKFLNPIFLLCVASWPQMCQKMRILKLQRLWFQAILPLGKWI